MAVVGVAKVLNSSQDTVLGAHTVYGDDHDFGGHQPFVQPAIRAVGAVIIRRR
jgi:hypothetical protein